jgi:hypothetical protein
MRLQRPKLPPPQPTPCPECGGQRVIAAATQSMRVGRPPGFALGWLGTSPMWAVVCVNCGMTTLYAKEPHKVLPGTIA